MQISRATCEELEHITWNAGIYLESGVLIYDKQEQFIVISARISHN